MWPFNLLCSPKKRTVRQETYHPHRTGLPRRASVTLSLEPLEERWLLNGAMTMTASPPSPQPSFFNAAYTLFWDGVQMIDAQYTGNTYFGAVFFGNSQGIAGVNASIAYNSPYAGPFASLFVLAGEAMEYENLLVGRVQAESF
jgi:hypothetical protein